MSGVFKLTGPIRVELLRRNEPEQMKSNVQLYRVLEDITVITPQGRPITVERGFVTNFGSVPAFARVYVSNENPAMGTPTLFHDWNYAKKELTREAADELLYHMLLAEGMRPAQAWLVWKSVRIGGASHWSS